MASLSTRMIGAALLQSDTYEEVEADTSATAQAIAVVVVASFAAGIGALGPFGLFAALKSTVASLIGWVAWVSMTYLVGAKLLPEPHTKADMGELLRTTGFAFSPGVLKIVAIIPFVGWILSIAITVWMLVAMVIAVRQAFDYQSIERALGVSIIGFIAYLVISFVFGGLTLLSGF